MKLQILIPQYKETDAEIKPLLDSIAMQQCIDFADIGVIICNDGTEVHLSEGFLQSYPFKIEYYLCEHRGVSATRNACLDRAIADYVMFCDADDMFCSLTGIYEIFHETETWFDTLVSRFTEEGRHHVTKEHYLIDHEHDCTFVHGKVHRRGYLTENNIRFNDELTVHEDSYFNVLCQSLTKDIRYVEKPFYMWKWRDNSICRGDEEYILKTYPHVIIGNDALVEELTARGEPNKAIYHVISMFYTVYYTMQMHEWVDEKNKEYRRITEKRFAEYYDKWKDVWNKVKPSEKMNVSQDVRPRKVREGMPMESITMGDWLKHIEEMI